MILLPSFHSAITCTSLGPTQSVLLRSIGTKAAVGVGYQYVCTWIALGAALRFVAPPRLVEQSSDKPGLVARLASAAGSAVARSPWRAIGGAAVVVLAALWGSTRIAINSYSVLETFSENHPAVQTLRLV